MNWPHGRYTSNNNSRLKNQNEAEESYQTPVTVLTIKASKGDVVIEVTDPDGYQIGKYIVIQESLIYLWKGKALILERSLCRDFLAGTQVRPLSDEDQHRTEDDGEIYLHNPLQSHSHNAGHGCSTNSHSYNEGHGNSTNSHSYNEGQGNFTNSHGQNGNGGTPGLIELDGQGGAPPWKMEKPMRMTNLSDFRVENPNLLLRGRELQSRI